MKASDKCHARLSEAGGKLEEKIEQFVNLPKRSDLADNSLNYLTNNLPLT